MEEAEPAGPLITTTPKAPERAPKQPKNPKLEWPWHLQTAANCQGTWHLTKRVKLSGPVLAGGIRLAGQGCAAAAAPQRNSCQAPAVNCNRTYNLTAVDSEASPLTHLFAPARSTRSSIVRCENFRLHKPEGSRWEMWEGTQQKCVEKRTECADCQDAPGGDSREQIDKLRDSLSPGQQGYLFPLLWRIEIEI